MLPTCRGGLNTVRCWSASRRRSRLDIGSTDHLRIAITSNYKSLTELHTQNISELTPTSELPLNSSSSCLQDNSSARTTQKTRPLYCCRGVFTAPLQSNGRGADYIENTALLSSRAFILLALPSNGWSLLSHCLATGLYATITIV
jgi:hypothetical protein